MSSSSSSSSSLQRPPPRKKNGVVVATTRTITNVAAVKPAAAKNRRRRRPRNRRGGGMGSNMLGPLTQDYCKSLVDPFEFTGCRLGWGTMVETSLSSAYYRVDLTANVDGSLAILAFPSAADMFFYNASGAVGTTWTTIAAIDSAAIAANYSSGRIISLGIRATPSLAMTTAPGYVFGGTLPFATNTMINTLTPGDLENFPTSQFLGNANAGASCTGRPLDVSSFEFYPQVVNAGGFQTGTVLPFAVPYIVFLGLPASAHVQVEILMNFEGLPLLSHAATALPPQTASSSSLNEEWLTPDKLWKNIAEKLPNVARAFNQAADTDASTLFRGARAVGRIYRNYQNQRNYRTNLNYPMLL